MRIHKAPGVIDRFVERHTTLDRIKTYAEVGFIAVAGTFVGKQVFSGVVAAYEHFTTPQPSEAQPDELTEFDDSID